jgi:hypothetical protein
LTYGAGVKGKIGGAIEERAAFQLLPLQLVLRGFL